jgi:hypothetical protein
MCNVCYDQAGHENDHQDGHHEEADEANCPMCHPEIVVDRSRKSSERVSKGRIDHRPCYAVGAHDKTFKGREGCRKARA